MYTNTYIHMVMSISFTYTKPFTAEEVTSKLERAEYCQIPSEHSNCFCGIVFLGVLGRRRRKPTCLIIYKQTFLEC